MRHRGAIARKLLSTWYMSRASSCRKEDGVFLALVPHLLKSDGGFPHSFLPEKRGIHIVFGSVTKQDSLLWPRTCCLGNRLAKARSSNAAFRCFLVGSSVRKEAKSLTLTLWRNCFEDELRSAGCSDTLKRYSKEFRRRDQEFTHQEKGEQTMSSNVVRVHLGLRSGFIVRSMALTADS